MDETLEVQVGKLLRQRGWRLAAAESCTGGLLGHRITNVPGSSTYYVGSVTAYAYEAKVRLLGVQWETLERYGAVSRETVIEMARGARRALAANVGVSVSGIAGPGGGTPEKPVGTTWIGISAPGFDQAWEYRWPGDRLQIKEQSAEEALRLLADFLQTRNEEKEAMEPVDVTALFDAEGNITPRRFVYQGNEVPVLGTGRRWEDDLGKHVLVMGPGDQVFELVFVTAEARWYLQSFGLRRGIA